MINKIWSVLFQSDSKAQGDWLRVCPDGIDGVRRTALEMAAALLPQRDRHIRGWLVEAALRAAMSSSSAKELIDLDPCNTYDTPLRGRHTEFYVEGAGWSVLSETVNRDLQVYNQAATVSLNPVTGAYTVTGADQAVVAGSAVVQGRTFGRIPFTESSTVKVTLPQDTSVYAADPGVPGRILFTVQGKVLPGGSALSYLRPGLAALAQYGVTRREHPFEDIGYAVLRIIKEA